MSAASRRRFLQVAALSALGSVAACNTAPGGGPGSGGRKGVLTWWDHQNQLEPAKKKIFEKFAESAGGMPVEYEYHNPGRMGQVLQLAKQGRELPDIHSNAGLELPAPQLIAGGWVAPLDLSDAAMDRLKGRLLEGVHIFDGKVYSFPIFDYHTYTAVTWFNRKLAAAADVDPESPPRTFDDFRKAASAVQKKSGGKSYGLMWNLAAPPRVTNQVDDLAQAAGFQGGGGLLYKTGEYAYHSEPYLQVLDFLLSLKKDKLLVPGAQTWLDDVARRRWVAGQACFYFDGPWCPGVALKDVPKFADSLASGPILVPDAGTEARTYHAHQGGEYWLSPTSKNKEAANRLLSDYFTTVDYSVAVAGTMSQPPRDRGALDKADVHPAYRKLNEWFADQVRLAPNPSVKNPDVAKVMAEFKPVEPGLGSIVQGAFSGDVPDVAKALKELSDKTSAERERALAAAKKKGAQIDLDAWAFPNWKPDTDYTVKMYK